MPELPDLVVFAKNLKKKVVAQPIVSVEVFNGMRMNADKEKVKWALVGTTIVDVVRDGKELFFTMGNGNAFSVHLMLNGRFKICDTKDIHKINSKILSLQFEEGSSLVISDFQGMCKVSLNPVANNVPDALSDAFTYEYFQNVVKKNGRKNIKALLITQSVVKGIGNAYVDEILWKADVSPESIAGKIPEAQLKELYESVAVVLEDAIAQIERIAPDIMSGEERSFLRVHNSKKDFTDEGDRIYMKKVASKITYYTEKQQVYK